VYESFKKFEFALLRKLKNILADRRKTNLSLRRNRWGNCARASFSFSWTTSCEKHHVWSRWAI